MALRFLLIACLQITLIFLIQQCLSSNQLTLQEYGPEPWEKFTIILSNDKRLGQGGELYQKPPSYDLKSTCSRLMIINYEPGDHIPGSLFQIYLKIRRTIPLQIAMYEEEEGNSHRFIGFIEAHFLKPKGLRVIEFNLPNFIKYGKRYRIIVSIWVTNIPKTAPRPHAIGILNFTTAEQSLVRTVRKSVAGKPSSIGSLAVPATLHELCYHKYDENGPLILKDLNVEEMELIDICNIFESAAELQKFRMRLFGLKAIIPPLDALNGLEAFVFGEIVPKQMSKLMYSDKDDFILQILYETIQTIEQLTDSSYSQYYGSLPVVKFKDQAYKEINSILFKISGRNILSGTLLEALTNINSFNIPTAFRPKFEKCDRKKYFNENFASSEYLYGGVHLWPENLPYFDHKSALYGNDSRTASSSSSKEASPKHGSSPMSAKLSRSQTLPAVPVG